MVTAYCYSQVQIMIEMVHDVVQQIQSQIKHFHLVQPSLLQPQPSTLHLPEIKQRLKTPRAMFQVLERLAQVLSRCMLGI